jgi:hypothetical protein
MAKGSHFLLRPRLIVGVHSDIPIILYGRAGHVCVCQEEDFVAHTWSLHIRLYHQFTFSATFEIDINTSTLRQAHLPTTTLHQPKHRTQLI